MNAKITIDNYEGFMLDYMDGSLAPTELSAVEAFLASNPNIKAELEGLSETIIPIQEVTYQHKTNLKKSVYTDEVYFNEACIASVENTLSKQEEAELNAFCELNPSKKKSFTLFAATKFVPNLNIIFPNKEVLYKKAAIIYLKQGMQVAASIAAVIFIALFVNWQFMTPPAGYPLHSSNYRANSLSNTTEKQDHIEPIQMGKTIQESLKTESTTLIASSSSTIEKQAYTAPEQEARFTLAKLSLKQTKTVNTTNIEFLAGYIPQVEIPVVNQAIYDEHESLLARVYKNLKGDKIVESHLPNTASNPTLLSFLSDVTQNKFQYAQTDNGKLENIAYRGRLLSFQLPLKSNNN